MPGPFNEGQLQTLGALCDAVFQSHTGEEAAEILAALPSDAPAWQKEKAEKFISTKFSDFPDALSALNEQFAISLSQTNLEALAMTLSLLASRAGTLVLTGYATAFIDLPILDREAVLKAWASSRIPLLRRAYRGFVAVCLYVIYTDVDDCALAIGYPQNGDPTRNEDSSRNRKHHAFKFESISQDYEYVDTDVLVVGSGAGGGVVSSELAKKGYKVLVVEKGEYYKPEDMTGTPKQGLKAMYELGGLIATECGSINVLAGSTFGGGTSVNWSASLRPQHFLRADWANTYGLPYFLSQEFSDSVEFVCDGMGVSSEHIKHNKPNQILINGSKKLGYHVEAIPQNTNGAQHSDGFCSFGCVYSEKQSGPVNWLRKASETGNTKFFTGTSVEKLLFAKDRFSPAPTAETLSKFTPASSRRVCVGALIKNKAGKFAIVRAKESVIVSAGSINSPVVLMKSGLKNPRIGQNLKLHPTTYVSGFYDQQINPWEGSIMTAVSTVQENWDGSHHGVKLEVLMSFPGGHAASFIPWRSSKEHKKALIQYNHSFSLIAIARDRGSGRVVMDKSGQARMEYNLADYDALSLLRGIVAMAEIHLAAGAKRITTTQGGVEDYVPAPGHKYLSDPAWKAWVVKVESVGVQATKCGLGSAHQMASCGMGSKPTNSVVDPRARVWGTECLYVADASIFPTASGVNPMVTNLSLSHSIAQFVDQDIKETAATGAAVHL